MYLKFGMTIKDSVPHEIFIGFQSIFKGYILSIRHFHFMTGRVLVIYR